MKQFLFSTALLIFALGAPAQTLRGIVRNGETFQPLPHVNVLNETNGQTAGTSMAGVFVIDARPGDKLSFSFAAYHTIEVTGTAADTMRIELLPMSVALPAYTLHELTAFEKDSMEMAALYSQELNKKAIKPGFSSANGGGFTGLIGGPVQKISRSYKRNKRFKEHFRKDMEQRFIDTRYKPELVTTLTGLTGDTLIMFMNTHPMDYTFARSVSDLELKAWIRDTYKEYIKAGN